MGMAKWVMQLLKMIVVEWGTPWKSPFQKVSSDESAISKNVSVTQVASIKLKIQPSNAYIFLKRASFFMIQKPKLMYLKKGIQIYP